MNQNNKPLDHKLLTHLYQGTELKPYTGRPGAMRAYDFPSLVAGVAVPRKAPICAPTAK